MIIQCIQILHLLIYIFILSALFLPINLHLSAIIFSLIIIILWTFLENKCILTELEYYLLNKKIKKIKKGFGYRFINKIIKVNETSFDIFIYYSFILYILLLIYIYNQKLK